MSILDRFGRIADTYMSEKDRLLEADPERRRVFVGHSVWPVSYTHLTLPTSDLV